MSVPSSLSPQLPVSQIHSLTVRFNVSSIFHPNGQFNYQGTTYYRAPSVIITSGHSVCQLTPQNPQTMFLTDPRVPIYISLVGFTGTERPEDPRSCMTLLTLDEPALRTLNERGVRNLMIANIMDPPLPLTYVRASDLSITLLATKSINPPHASICCLTQDPEILIHPFAFAITPDNQEVPALQQVIRAQIMETPLIHNLQAKPS